MPRDSYRKGRNASLQFFFEETLCFLLPQPTLSAYDLIAPKNSTVIVLPCALVGGVLLARFL